MDLKSIYDLMDKFDASKCAYIELETEGMFLKLKKPEACVKTMAPAMPMPAVSGAASPLNQPAVAEEKDMPLANAPKDTVKSPLVGVFYAAPSPEKEAFVQPGDKVKKGDILCLIEAMKMMSEVVAPKDGVIKEVLVENGTMVEFDTPLFEIQE